MPRILRLREGRCWDAEGRERETRAHNTEPVPTPRRPHVPLLWRRRPRLAASTTNFNIFRRAESSHTSPKTFPHLPLAPWRLFLLLPTLLHPPPSPPVAALDLLRLSGAQQGPQEFPRLFWRPGCTSESQVLGGVGTHTHTRPPEPPDIHHSTSTTLQPFTDRTLPSYSQSNPTRSLPPVPVPPALAPLPANAISFILSSADQLLTPSFSSISSLASSLPHPLPSDSAEHRFGKYP